MSSPLALGTQTPCSTHLLHGGDQSWPRNRHSQGRAEHVPGWPSNSPSTDGNHSSLINAMKGLQQTHHLLLWAQPEWVSVLPEVTCFQTSPPRVSSWAGDQRSGGVWVQLWCLAQQEQQRPAMGHSRHLSSLQKPQAPADLVPSGYREEADTTEHRLTWHKTSALCQPPVSSWLFLASGTAGHRLQPFFLRW